MQEWHITFHRPSASEANFYFPKTQTAIWHITQVDFRHHYAVYQTGQKGGQLEFTGIHYSHYKCSIDGRLLVSQISEPTCVNGVAPSCLLPELKACSGQIKSIQAGEKKVCQMTFASASFPRKASHQSNRG